MRSSLGMALVTFAAVSLPGRARADRQEWRLAVAGVGANVLLSQSGADGSGFGAGGRVHVGYGLTNSVEIGGTASFLKTSALEFAGAHVAGQSGNLFADFYAVDVGVE